MKVILLIISIFQIFNYKLFNVHSQTVCHDHAFITIAILEKNIVESLLEPGFSLADSHPLEEFMEKNEYPIILEFGQQNDCYLFFSFTKHSFTEFKLEIPYVSHLDGFKGILYKPIIYASNYLDSISSRIIYGLPTYKSDMYMMNDSYEFSTREGKVSVKVTHLNQKWGDINDFPNFRYFTEINSNPWYCFSPFGSVKCAKMEIKQEEMKLRPIKLLVKIEGNILGEKLKNSSFTTMDIRNFALGSVEMKVPIKISFPFSCI